MSNGQGGDVRIWAAGGPGDPAPEAVTPHDYGSWHTAGQPWRICKRCGFHQYGAAPGVEDDDPHLHPNEPAECIPGKVTIAKIEGTGIDPKAIEQWLREHNVEMVDGTDLTTRMRTTIAFLRSAVKSGERITDWSEIDALLDETR